MKHLVLRESFFFSLSAIVGPLLIFGGLGYVLDDFFGTDKLFLFSGIAVAFIVTQFMMFKKVTEFANVSDTLAPKKEAPEEETVSDMK